MPVRRYDHQPTHIITDINVDKKLEVSFVPRGSNPLSKVILKKTADEPQTENFQMAILKSVAVAALMSTPVGVALAKSFETETALDTFLAKDEAGQKADLTAFAKAKGMSMDDMDGDETKSGVNKSDTISGGAGDDAISAAVAKALASNPEFVALQKENAELKKSLDGVTGGFVTATLEKRAETEFKGLGLPITKTVAVLKGLGEITDADARSDIEGILKAHAELAGKISKSVGLAEVAKDANSATAQLDKKAEDLAKAEKISFPVALTKVCEDPANAELIERADKEASDSLAA